MSDVTLILSKIQSGDSKACEELLPLVYEELRRLASARMANERSDHTLQATALVHEAYLRLVDAKGSKDWDNRTHFFAAAAEAMRRILVESARRRQTLKRGGDQQRVELADDLTQSIGADPGDLIDFNEALDRLQAEDPQAAEFVKLRLFAGLSVSEAGRMLGMPSSTAHDNWEYARAWFSCQVNEA